MPYKSNAQRRKFHSLLERHEISKTVVDEWEQINVIPCHGFVSGAERDKLPPSIFLEISSFFAV